MSAQDELAKLIAEEEEEISFNQYKYLSEQEGKVKLSKPLQEQLEILKKKYEYKQLNDKRWLKLDDQASAYHSKVRQPAYIHYIFVCRS